jgi:glc operon protein GlcG
MLLALVNPDLTNNSGGASMNNRHSLAFTCTLVLFATLTARAQTPTAPYGPPITLEQAKKVLAGAEAEARKNNWNVVIAIQDSGGHLVLLQRLDNTQFGSVQIAQQKAYSAVAFRRPTKVFQDGIAAGGEGLRLLKLEGATPVEGGLPIIVDGKVIGAIGVSGVTSQQDNQIAKAGADALK